MNVWHMDGNPRTRMVLLDSALWGQWALEEKARVELKIDQMIGMLSELKDSDNLEDGE